MRWLWPIPVAAFVVYPYLKRFTWLCHLWLGAVDGLAPVGAWAAIKGTLPWQAWALGAAVAAWVAGFDLFYALFDVDVDRAAGPPFVGDPLRRARRVRRRSRPPSRRRSACSWRPASGSTSGCLVLARRASRSGGLLLYEHSLVRPGDLRRLDAAFFTMNGVISVAFFVFVLADVL